MGAISFSLDEKLLGLLSRELPLRTFFETGTFKGESLRLARQFFPECHSVELSPEYHAAAVKNFAGQNGIHLHQGESPAHLRRHQAQLAAAPTLFWLDAHWCVADHTAGANSQSPLLGELQAIGSLHPQSAILIDDARLYLCPPPAPHRALDWPDFHAIAQALLALSSAHRLMILNDVILFFPASAQPAIARFAHEHGADWLHLATLARKYQAKKERLRRLNPFRSKR
ncbi:MAG: hypothetical protein JWR69_2509 [Pedosphaera sp.]|nr:hypothetical protein [Pedosphaera sp.]